MSQLPLFLIISFTVMLLSYALALRLSKKYKELKLLKKTMEEKVRERTKEKEDAVDQRINVMFDIANVTRTAALSKNEAASNGAGFEYNCYIFKITEREKEIIKCIAEGCTYKDVADKLFISDKTVAKHIQHIYEKTETKNKIELISRMVR